jgi:hypothetical protein
VGGGDTMVHSKQLVIGNVLDTRKSEVHMIERSGTETRITCDKNVDIESNIITFLIDRHSQFIGS